MRRLVFVLLASCGADQPALSNVTDLSCPSPGNLPFRVTSGFRHSQNANLAKMDTRIKHEVADTIGNPTGSVADTHLADNAMVGTTVAIDGTMGVTTTTGGLFSMPMTDEYVSAWTYDGSKWNQLGRGLTDADGLYSLPAALVPNGQPIFSILEANGTCAPGYDYTFPMGAKVVVTDIDGTLTTNDNELAMEIADPTHDPAMMGHADAMLQAWAMKGYPIVYLTNRPHPLRVETRSWIAEKMMPGGAVITSNGTATDASAYKTVWLERMVTNFGWNIVAAYGNASTDISAYNNAGVPKSQTFIVGPLAGSDGTQPIDNMDFEAHITSYIDAQPNNP